MGHDRPAGLVVAEKPKETDVAKAKLGTAIKQLLLPVPAQRQGRVAAADGVLQEMGQRGRFFP